LSAIWNLIIRAYLLFGAWYLVLLVAG